MDALAAEVLKLLKKRHQSDRGMILRLVDTHQAGFAYTWSGRSEFVYRLSLRITAATDILGLKELVTRCDFNVKACWQPVIPGGAKRRRGKYSL